MGAPRDVAIVGIYATKQGRNLGRTGLSLTMEAFHGALADAGLTRHEVDGWFNFDFPAQSYGPTLGDVAFQLGRPMTVVGRCSGVPALLYAARRSATGRRRHRHPVRRSRRTTDGATAGLHPPGLRVHRVDRLDHSRADGVADPRATWRVRHHARATRPLRGRAAQQREHQPRSGDVRPRVRTPCRTCSIRA